VTRPAFRFAAIAAVLIIGLVAAELGLRSIGAAYTNLVRTPPASFAPGDTVKLLAIGDSFTFGIGADGPHSYPDQLQELLDENFGANACRVLNWGLPAQNSSEALLALAGAFDHDLHPDFVLVAVGINNYWNWHLASHFLPGDDALGRVHAAASGWRVWRFLAVLFSGGPAAAGKLYAKNDETDRNDPWFAHLRDDGPAWLTQWLAADFAAMRDLCRQRGAKLVLINYHLPSKTTAAAFRRFTDDPDVIAVDAAHPSGALEDVLSKDGWHPNATGYRRVARIVATALDPALRRMLPAKSP